MKQNVRLISNTCASACKPPVSAISFVTKAFVSSRKIFAFLWTVVSGTLIDVYKRSVILRFAIVFEIHFHEIILERRAGMSFIHLELLKKSAAFLAFFIVTKTPSCLIGVKGVKCILMCWCPVYFTDKHHLQFMHLPSHWPTLFL